MDVYEQEFGNLLSYRIEPTKHQMFRRCLRQRVLAMCKYLPLEMVELRVQGLWNKFLARHPEIR